MAKRILLIVSGGIAAYKALDIARSFLRHKIAVTPILTENAKEFVTELSFEVLCGEKVHSALFSPIKAGSSGHESQIGHIELARSADLILVCPATAHLIARMAYGLADDLATTILLATTSPIFIAPAMNVRMWEHPATQENLRRLKERHIHIIEPSEGTMACGEYGVGRLAQTQDILDAIFSFYDNKREVKKDLEAKKILITAGPTREEIDPVRYISNYSSGIQGYAIAEELAERGACVTLVSGPVSLPTPKNVKRIDVITATQMLEACMGVLEGQDVAICVAAICDWRPIYQKEKMKKQNNEVPTLCLTENPDILAEISVHAERPPLVIGFAAETDSLLENAQKKKARKKCDWLLANNVSQEKMGKKIFGSKNNKILFLQGEDYEEWSEMPKKEIASRLADKITVFFKNDREEDR